MRDILATLEREHAEMRELFARMNATADGDAETREQLLGQIEGVLIPHAKWEEYHFYPALARRASHAQMLQHAEAIAEHRAVELAVLPDLHAADTDTRQFAGTAKVCGELVGHHADEEESGIFAAMRQLYSPEELAGLDEDYAAWKESAASDAIETYTRFKTGAAAMMRNPDAPG